MTALPVDRLAALEAETALAELDGDRAAGLSAAEAKARRERFGANEPARPGRTVGAVLLARLRSPLLGLLIVAACVSIGVGEHTDGAMILGILLLSVGLGFANEFRSERTAVALRERTGRRATVLRDGALDELPAADLVPGAMAITHPALAEAGKAYFFRRRVAASAGEPA